MIAFAELKPRVAGVGCQGSGPQCWRGQWAELEAPLSKEQLGWEATRPG